MATVATVSPGVLLDPNAKTIPSLPQEQLPIPSSLPDIAILQPDVRAPFAAIAKLFDHLRTNPDLAASLNRVYPTRGLYKTAATSNPLSDQKLTIDLSPNRISHIPADLQSSLMSHGFGEVINFFSTVITKHLDSILDALSATIDVDLGTIHQSRNINFRLCDYTPHTASPTNENGCGAHRDYGTFSIIFQDGNSGLEIEDPVKPDAWNPVPSDAVVVLCGWCAHILSGGELRAVRHRVRRQLGIRRLSAVLFVAPDLEVALKPMTAGKPVVEFSEKILNGEINVKWFKEVMGKRWRWREGNEELKDGDEISQDEDIEKLILG